MQLPGTPIWASTKRQGQTQLASGTFTLAVVMNRLLQPESPQLMYEQFGEFYAQPFCCYASWPAGATDDVPFQTGDILLIGTNTDGTNNTWTGRTYGIFGVHENANNFIKLYLHVPVA